MSYFSRLTDIVTCSLTALLAEADNPQAALCEIIAEMEEGLAGAQRSAKTAAAAEARIRSELGEHQTDVQKWIDTAKRELADGQEDRARQALARKYEVDDLIAGLEQQHHAAVATRDHLMTTLRALEARLADARRRQLDMAPRSGTQSSAAADSAPEEFESAWSNRKDQIDAELEALKRELGHDNQTAPRN